MARFSGVVENHVHDHLDAGGVQGPDHVPELVERSKWTAFGAVSRMRSEECHGTVAPVVAEPRGSVLHIELLNRHELDCRDAELLEVGDLLHESCIGAAFFRAHPGVRVPGESAHVELVDDARGIVVLEGLVSFPVIARRVHHAAFGCMGTVVARTARRYAVIVLAQHHGPCIGIEQHLVTVVEVAPCRIEGSIHPISIELARPDAGHETVPVVKGPVELGIEADDTLRPGIVRIVEQEELHGVTAPGKQGEVHPVLIHGRPQGVAPARSDLLRCHWRETLSIIIKVHGISPCSMLSCRESRERRMSKQSCPLTTTMQFTISC
ncbi:MAG: hypothetical protein BWZ01_02959 [Deltaproteobacteria bacterium ADurb.BinA179]|nr:MAG: hypothetical protein BWZ01_02959 [Deltaproteobacteria bacterium ADurb.BinA179]